MLLEYPDYRDYYHPSANAELQRNMQVRRSQSDVTNRSTKKSRHRKPRKDSPDPKRHPVTTAEVHSREQIGGRKTTSSTQERSSKKSQNGSSKSRSESNHQNIAPQRSYEAQTKTINLQENEFPPSATDSAKLRAVGGQKDKGHQNITDDDKKNISPEASNEPANQKESYVYAVPIKSKSKSTLDQLQSLSKTTDFSEEKTDESSLRQTNVSAYVRDHRVPYSTETEMPPENQPQPDASTVPSGSPMRKSTKPRGSSASRTESVDLATVGELKTRFVKCLANVKYLALNRKDLSYNWTSYCSKSITIYIYTVKSTFQK